MSPVELADGRAPGGDAPIVARWGGVPGLTGQPTSVHRNGVAVDVVGRRGRQEHHRSGQVVWQSPATCGNALQDGGVATRIGAQGGGIVGRHIAGGDGVYVDAVVGPLVGHQAGDAHDAALGCGVGRHTHATLERQHGGDVDDLAARALGDELACHGLAEEKDRFQIDAHHVVPVLFTETQRVVAADDARVVDQDVDVPCQSGRLLHQIFDAIDVGEVGAQVQELAVQGPDLLGRFGGFRDVDANDVCAGLGERPCHALAQSGIATGDDGDFARESELIEDHGGVQSV